MMNQPNILERMIITFPDGQEEEITVQDQPIETILMKYGIEPLEVVISRNGEIIPEDVIPEDTDRIVIIRISHGG